MGDLDLEKVGMGGKLEGGKGDRDLCLVCTVNRKFLIKKVSKTIKKNF